MERVTARDVLLDGCRVGDELRAMGDHLQHEAAAQVVDVGRQLLARFLHDVDEQVHDESVLDVRLVHRVLCGCAELVRELVARDPAVAAQNRRRGPQTSARVNRSTDRQDAARAGRGAGRTRRGQDAARGVCGEGITPYDLKETVSVAISMRALAFGAGGVFWVAMVVPAAACHAERGGDWGGRRLRRGERAEERRREGEKRERREKREEGGERERGESDGDRTGTCA